MNLALRYALGLEEYTYPTEIISDDEKLNLEKSFLESSYVLQNALDNYQDISHDKQTVSSYQNLLEENNADHITLECISIGLNHLLNKHSIKTNDSVTSLESFGMESGFINPLDTVGNIFTGLKKAASDAIKYILQKLKDWKNRFVAFFRKVFLVKRKASNNAAKTAVQTVVATANANPSAVQQVVNAPPSNPSVKVEDVQVTPNDIVFKLILDEQGIKNLIYAVDVRMIVPQYKTFIHGLSGIIRTVLAGKLEQDIEGFVYDQIVNSSLRFSGIHRNLSMNSSTGIGTVKFTIGYRIIEITYEDSNKSLEEVFKSEFEDADIERYYQDTRIKMGINKHNGYILNTKLIEKLTKVQDEILYILETITKDKNDIDAKQPLVENVSTNLELITHLYADITMSQIKELMDASNMIDTILNTTLTPIANSN